MMQLRRPPVTHLERIRSEPAALGLLAMLVLAGVAACGSPTGGGSTYVSPEVPREKDGLQLVTHDADFEREYLAPGLDLSRYHSVLLAPLDLVYTQDYKREHALQRDAESGQLVPQALLEQDHQGDLEQLRSLFRQALRAELTRDGAYNLVDEPAEGVLVLAPGLIDLDLQPADEASESPDTAAYARPQAVVVGASLKDGKTGARLAEILQSSQNTSDMVEGHEGVDFWGDIRYAFAQWARDFRAMLDHLRAAHAPAR